jgi:hypothetical protein
MKMNLIQVSDDSESDSSDDSDDSDDYESDDDESGNGNVCTIEDGSCKIIDLSTISSSANYLKPSSSHSEIKVIELKSNIRSSNEYVGNSSHDEDVDDDEDDDEDEDEDEDDDEDDDEDMNCEKNDAMNDIESKNDDSDNQHHANVNIKKMKSIVIEDITTTSVSLEEMKNMPVNSLRSLAKTKLSNIDVPTINKMSKKDILKALHEE